MRFIFSFPTITSGWRMMRRGYKTSTNDRRNWTITPKPTWQHLTGCVLMCLILSGCAGRGTSQPIPIPVERPLPPLPADVIICFDRLTPAPLQDSTLTKAQTLRLIMGLRKSELTQSACGKRFIAFYNQILQSNNHFNIGGQ